jgi:DNA-binding MarR family transcriptional regulator
MYAILAYRLFQVNISIMESQKQYISSIHDPEYHRIIDALILLREKSKLSQKAIAESIGLTQPDVSKIERRERRIDILEALRWVRASNADPAAFFAQFSSSEI